MIIELLVLWNCILTIFILSVMKWQINQADLLSGMNVSINRLRDEVRK